MLRKILTVGLLIIATGSEAGIYDECAAAISRADNATVERLAKLIRRFTDIPAQAVKKAEECVTAAEGSPHRYYSKTKEFFPNEEYEASVKQAMLEEALLEKQRRENEQRRKELAEMERQLAREEALRRKKLAEIERQKAIAQEAVRAENAALINRDVYLVCNELFKKNKVQAMTSEICLSSFSVNGHPELGKPMPQE